MKDLIIPTKVENGIYINDIDLRFPGLIIVFEDNKAIGYIQLNDSMWNWYDTIEGEEPVDRGMDLENLLNNIKEIKPNIVFKVLTFYE